MVSYIPRKRLGVALAVAGIALFFVGILAGSTFLLIMATILVAVGVLKG